MIITRRQLLACAAATAASTLCRRSWSADGTGPAIRALVVGARDDDGPEEPCTVAVLAAGTTAIRAADLLLAVGIDGLLVRELPPAMAQHHPLCVALVGSEARANGQAAHLLARAARSGGRLLVLGQARDVDLLAGAAARQGVEPVVVACREDAGLFADFVKSVCSPGLRPGYVGFDPRDFEALADSGGPARFVRLEIGDWASPRCDAAAVAESLAPPLTNQPCTGVLLTVFAPSEDPDFTLQSLDDWVCWFQGLAPGEANIVFTVHDDPAAPHALLTSFFPAPGRDAPEGRWRQGGFA